MAGIHFAILADSTEGQPSEDSADATGIRNNVSEAASAAVADDAAAAAADAAMDHPSTAAQADGTALLIVLQTLFLSNNFI